MRNLLRVSWDRIFLWTLLALSSIPLHLMYNSAVFATLSYQDFAVFFVAVNFLTGADYSIMDHDSDLRPETKVNSAPSSMDFSLALQLLRNTLGSLQRLENKECIEDYSPLIVSNRGNVLVVSSYQNSTHSLLGIDASHTYGFLSDFMPSAWICKGQCNCEVNEVKANANDWTYCNGAEWYESPQYPIAYCLSTKTEDRCKLQFSVAIMVIVIACNFIKLVSISVVIWKPRFHPLITLGDAIASFLNEPDSTTNGICLAGKPNSLKRKHRQDLPKQYNLKPYSWFDAASKRRWNFFIIPCLLALLSAIGLLIYADSPRYVADFQLPSILSYAFGAVRPEAVLQLKIHLGDSNLIAMVLLANSPQLLLSVFYLTYNSLYTRMLLVEEWSGYAHDRKGLRVTLPVGEQRSTYRLQLPYRYGILLLVMSGILHWLVSQSIFLVRIITYDYTGSEYPEHNITTCGYSPIALLVTTVVGAVALLLGIAISFRRYKPGMPLAGSCSGAVSAACHPPDTDKGASAKKLMWGVLNQEGPPELGDEVGRCSFTSFEIEKPVIRKIYAGYGRRGRRRLQRAASRKRGIRPPTGVKQLTNPLSQRVQPHISKNNFRQVEDLILNIGSLRIEHSDQNGTALCTPISLRQ